MGLICIILDSYKQIYFAMLPSPLTSSVDDGTLDFKRVCVLQHSRIWYNYYSVKIGPCFLKPFYLYHVYRFITQEFVLLRSATIPTFRDPHDFHTACQNIASFLGLLTLLIQPGITLLFHHLLHKVEIHRRHVNIALEHILLQSISSRENSAFAHSVAAIAGWAEAVWNEKFARHFCTWPSVGIKIKAFGSWIQRPIH